MNLYRVTISSYADAVYMVLANDETQASKYVVKKYEDWDYTVAAYVSKIELIAVEGHFGEPIPLLNATQGNKRNF